MNTQQAILDFLQKHPYLCAEDLSQTLLKTRANIQYHLKHLETAGLIEQIHPAPVIKSQGRPRNYYALSSRSRSSNFINLAGASLKMLIPLGISSKSLNSAIKEIARLLLSPSTLQTAMTLSKRLNRLAIELSAHGYQARWEARADGPSVVFRNCPYYALLPQHPELCLVDAAILKSFLARDVTQQAKIQLPQVTSCRFTVRNQT
jgi:predicted ArsR family transcriptional regulator